MKGDSLPNSDHVVRHCEKKFLYDNESVSAGNFLPRKDGSGKVIEEYLSVGWLEHYATGDRETQLAALRKVMHPNIRKFHKKDKLALLNVGNAINMVQMGTRNSQVIRILHEPSKVVGKEDEAHSGIFDTGADETRIAELLVEAVNEVVPAR